MHPFLALAFPILIVLMVGAWGLGTLVYREHPWSIGGWIPLTGLAGTGSLMLVGMLFDSGASTGGAEGAFAAMGAAGGMVLFLPCPLFLGLSVYVRPRGPHSPWAILCGSLILMAALGFLRSVAAAL
ncbi:MAG: hypothetical protein JNL10_07865 [Verrucomicrobiales bacterium]|nr:hypothetical protein [Verrucomicrobiales bacterium]